MTSSRSQAIFLVSKYVFSWLRSRAAMEGSKLLAEDVSQSKVTFLAVDVLVVNGCFVTKPRERIVAPFLSEKSAHPRHVHISWSCDVAKSFGSICIHRQEQRAAENDFLALHRQQFRESDGLWLHSVHE